MNAFVTTILFLVALFMATLYFLYYYEKWSPISTLNQLKKKKEKDQNNAVD